MNAHRKAPFVPTLNDHISPSDRQGVEFRVATQIIKALPPGFLGLDREGARCGLSPTVMAEALRRLLKRLHAEAPGAQE